MVKCVAKKTVNGFWPRFEMVHVGISKIIEFFIRNSPDMPTERFAHQRETTTSRIVKKSRIADYMGAKLPFELGTQNSIYAPNSHEQNASASN